MSIQTVSATPFDAVQIEARPGGVASDVWLRKNIEKGTANYDENSDATIEFYRADEVHFVAVGIPSVEEISASFDVLWTEHDDDGLTDSQRISKLAQQIEDTNAALLELGDLVGGE